MKILYGVQGTGNGHIARARMMAKHLARRNVYPQFLFSGRRFDRYFDMEVFGDYQLRHGLTFATLDGRISKITTLIQAKPLQFIRDVRSLKLGDYDLVISDFEPVSAWAAKLQGLAAVGIGHQYAFDFPQVPQHKVDWVNQMIMRHFAPAHHRIGLHWHHFNAPILPPIINPDERRLALAQPPHFVVYLPFENQQTVTRLLQALPDYRFIQYSPELTDAQMGNVTLQRSNLHGFKKDLCSASGVICNAGFELISECLHMGLPALAKPVSGQSEQLSNAQALAQLQQATVMPFLDESAIAQWLHQLPAQPPQTYPDVAEALCDWLLAGQWDQTQYLVDTLWRRNPATAPAQTYA